jgi:hypothetical protein
MTECGKAQPDQSKGRGNLARLEPVACGREAEEVRLPQMKVYMCPTCDRQPGYPK